MVGVSINGKGKVEVFLANINIRGYRIYLYIIFKIMCKLKFFISAMSCFLFGSLLFTACHHDEKKEYTNVILIYADDLGWAQSSPYGSDYYYTPNLERLADNGMSFSNAYSAAAICSPARASLLTGKYPARLHMTDFIPGDRPNIYPLIQPLMQMHLPIEEYTLGNLFKDAGYKTAFFGKWHLSKEKFGPVSLENYPDKQGFDDFFVIDKPDRQTNPEMDPHWSDLIGNTSLGFIQNNQDAPFFLIMSFSAIHDPLIERADSVKMWRENALSEKPENNPIIAAILSRMDRNVGKVLDKLDELKLSEHTLVIFYSDNGGLAQHNVVFYKDYYPDSEQEGLEIADQKPLRKGKGFLYEGGIRVPLIIRWPGVIEGGRVTDEIVSTYDFMPTFSDLLGSQAKMDVDGVSFLALLKDAIPLPDRNHYWHYPHYHRQSGAPPSGAIRSGEWKLIEWFENSLLETDDPVYELYNLNNDIGETNNLIEHEQEIAQELINELKLWRKKVDAQMPVKNIHY